MGGHAPVEGGAEAEEEPIGEGRGTDADGLESREQGA